MEQLLNDLQEISNKLYNQLGATDEVIDLQIAINAFRNRYNIVDKTQLTKSNPGFTQ